jgi:hypothetical protein
MNFLIKLLLPFAIKAVLQKFGLPLDLEDEVGGILSRLKSIWNAIKAKGGSDAQALAAVKAEANIMLSSYREGPDSKKTEGSIKGGEPYNV